MSQNPARTLIIRLSSLGDVVLATAALEVYRSRGERVDWVVSKEFAPLLQGHPAIHRLWEFDRKSGFKGWWRLCRELGSQGYEEVLDLHRTIRATLLRVSLLLGRGRSQGMPRARWRRYEKARWAVWAGIRFGSLWPARLLPSPVAARFAGAAGGSGHERPNLKHLVHDPFSGFEVEEFQGQAALPRLAVMPSALWPGKRWSVDRYEEVLRSSSDIWMPVIFGTAQDTASLELVARLTRAGMPFLNGVGRWTLAQAAAALGNCSAYLGSDTGLAHLAEALGVRTWVLWGPTSPRLGYGPWQTGSEVIQTKLGCRPCSQNGKRGCFRFWEPYACLRRLSADEVSERISDQGK